MLDVHRPDLPSAPQRFTTRHKTESTGYWQIHLWTGRHGDSRTGRGQRHGMMSSWRECPQTARGTKRRHSKHQSWHNINISVRRLELSVPFQHKYCYIRDERSGVKSYSYPVKKGQWYINLNSGRLFVQQPPKKRKGSRSSFKLLR